MYCPYDKNTIMIEEKHDYHHTGNRPIQPLNTILSTLYRCPECGVGIESSQQVRVTPVKTDWVKPVSETVKAIWEEVAKGQSIEAVERADDEIGVIVKFEKEDIHEGKDTDSRGDKCLKNTVTNKPRRKVRRKKGGNIRP